MNQSIRKARKGQRPRCARGKVFPLLGRKCRTHGEPLRYSPRMGIHCPTCEAVAFVIMVVAAHDER